MTTAFLQHLMNEQNIKNLSEQGKTCLQQGLYEEGLAVFKRLANTTPYDPRVHYQCGLALHSLGQLQPALTAYRTALKFSPNNPDVLNAIANTYYTLGNREKSVSYYEKSYAAYPDNPQTLFNLVHMNNYRADSPVTKKLYSQHRSTGLSDPNRAAVCFALAEILAKQGELQEAFPYYEEGNRHAFALFPDYNLERDLTVLDNIKAMFTPALFKQCAGVGSNDATPLFILGMPRSGTTLVEQVLSSHSQVGTAGEINAMSILAFRTIPQLTGKPFPRALQTLHPAQLQILGEQYLGYLRRYNSVQAVYICDKMPTNFLFIGLIYMLFPKAKIVHCVRNPADTCWSLYKHLFLGRNPYCYDQQVLGRFYMAYRSLMRHWHHTLPGVVHDIEYEKLIESPEENIRALLNYCNLTWEENCLHFHRTNRPIATASALQVRRPLYKTAIKSWEPVADKLHPLHEALGLLHTR